LEVSFLESHSESSHLGRRETAEDKAAVVNKYAQEHLDMTADVDISDDKQRKPEYQNSPLGKRYCESPNQDKDV
jgi:hypothetical protein